MFEPQALQKIVKDSLVNVPEDHHMAIVTVANKDGVRTAVAVKINNEWDVQGYVDVKKSQLPNTSKLTAEYGVVVQWSK